MPAKIKAETESALERVIDFRYSGDEFGIDGIFRSSPGQKIGKQILDLLDFIHRLRHQSFVISLLPFFKEILRSVEEGENVFEPSEDAMGSFNRAMTTLLRELPRWSQTTSSVESETNRQEMDSMWFVSLVSFSLYAYLQAYTDDLIDLLESIPALVQQVSEYLKNLKKKKSRSCRQRAEGFKGLKSMGMKRRILMLSSALGLDDIIDTVIDVRELDSAKKAFDRFIDIRNKLAHYNPHLSPSGYSESEFEKDVADLVAEMKPISTASLFQGLEHMTAAYRIMFTSLRDNYIFLSKLGGIVVMAATYPALVDCALVERLQSEDS